MKLPTIDLSTILFLFYLLALLLATRGFTTHLRDDAAHPAGSSVHPHTL